MLSRQKTSDEKHELIKQILDDLFKNGEGFKMTYPAIAQYLIDRRLSTYTENTTLKLIKKYAPEIKAKYRAK